jgi:hypothetical protein
MLRLGDTRDGEFVCFRGEGLRDGPFFRYRRAIPRMAIEQVGISSALTIDQLKRKRAPWAFRPRTEQSRLARTRSPYFGRSWEKSTPLATGFSPDAA